MKNISNFLLPSVVGIGTYIIINKFFPEKIQSFDDDPLTDLRGGADTPKIFAKILKKITTDRALKVALVALFGTTAFQHFQAEIQALLIDDVFNHIKVRHTEGDLKILCNIVNEYDLHLHTKTMREVIVSNSLSDEHKVTLLKVKLDFIMGNESGGKARFLIMAISAAILTFTVSGVGGLALMLEALYRLFQEGKISRAVYNEVLKALQKNWGSAIPIDHFLG